MTSSLVGSEMCIRDRRQCYRPLPRSPHDGRRLATSDQPQRLVLGCDTVSYTHLTLPTICSV
eukprot:5552091-Prorocentrum_lima.AAC.1